MKLLDFSPQWRFSAPGSLPDSAVQAFIVMVGQIASQRVPKAIKEQFKQAFCMAGGIPYYPSSSDRFIDEDLQVAAFAAATNAPVFIDAFDNVLMRLKHSDPTLGTPDDGLVNRLLIEHKVGMMIERPNLLSSKGNFDVVVPSTMSMDEEARNLILRSLTEVEHALGENRGLDAVQKVFWLLETFSTAFKNPELSGGPIQQSYFNKIVYKLREKGVADGHQSKILEWMMTLYGYLSSPTGGGVRHGTDLAEGRPLDLDEARLFCNLARSYLVFLIAEYERLVRR
jgi:hypothetical protein